MKILIVSETLHTGGAEIFILRLARHLLKAGIDVTVLNMNVEYENKEMTAQFPDVTIIRMKIPFLKLLDKLDQLLMRVGVDFSIKYFLQSRTIRKRFVETYDIIHTNYSRIDYVFARIKNKTNGFRHLVSVHGDYSDQYYRAQAGEMTGWLNVQRKISFISNTVDKLVVVSEEQRNFFQNFFNFPKDKLQKIYYGFDEYGSSSNSLEKESQAFTIGMVARGTPQKGWQILIDCFLKMPAGNKLVLIGGGTYMENLKSKYKLRSDISFLGFLSEPLKEVKNFDVVVLPSLYPFESLPNSIIEALYCGKPVIAADTGEIKTMITDPESGKMAGFVIDMKNEEVAAAELLEHLLFLSHDKERIEELSLLAKKCFSRFSMDKCVADYLLLYRNLFEN